jgi:WD40 repeat protein
MVTVVDRTGTEVTRLETPGVGVHSVAFGATGERLIATLESPAAYDPTAGRLVVWDWRAGQIVPTVAAEAGLVVASPTPDLIAVIPHWRAERQELELRDARNAQLVTTLAGTSELSDVAFSTDGTQLATAGSDGEVRIWDVESGRLLQTLSGHPAAVSSVSFNDDGSQLASIEVEGVVRVWALDVADLADIARRRLTRGLTDDECRQYLHTEVCADDRQPATTN